MDERFEEFALEAGVECRPVDENPLDLRVEIDALVAHAYGLVETDLHIMFDDFTEATVSSAYRERLVERFRDLG